MFDIIKIGQRMKFRREFLDLTLDEVANSVGVAKTTIMRYENGDILRPKIPVLQSIANSLGVRPDWLLCQSDQMEDEAHWDWDGTYLKKLREAANISPEETARRLGIPASRYFAIETSAARPSVPVLVSLAQIFCTSTDCLIGLEFSPQNYSASAGYTAADVSMIHAYQSAPKEVKRIVDAALSPYHPTSLPFVANNYNDGPINIPHDLSLKECAIPSDPNEYY